MKNIHIKIGKKRGCKGTRLFFLCVHKPLLKQLTYWLWVTAATPLAVFIILYTGLMIPNYDVAVVNIAKANTGEELCGLDVVECPSEQKGIIREVTAYNSVPAQTDSTPCISADGTDICKRYANGERICATNAYPLGTKLNIDKYGDCIVADRMNSRFQNRVDVYLGMDIERAIKWGKQNLSVTKL